jgi:ferredoxin, 2Fe-2S
MPKITFLPDNLSIVVPSGTSLLEAGQKAGAKIGSACGGVCACSTCHVWVREGLASLSEQSEKEMDILDKACQAEVADADALVEITQESRKTFFDEHPDERKAESPPPPSTP